MIKKVLGIPPAPGRGCKTCKHAEFPLTPTGRIRQNLPGKCTYDVVMPPIPAALNLGGMHRWAIWPDDFTNCPTYEKK